jgi:hypothetical protein
VCPVTPVSIEPITTPKVPPVGASSCESFQVLNPSSGKYEWKRLCK